MIHITETIHISKLKENPRNIRKHFDEEFISRLADSIRRHGIVSPILALPDGTVVAGNQRFRAAKKAGISELLIGRDVIFLDPQATDQKRIDSVNAIENIVRRQLNVLEEAEGLWIVLRDHIGFKTPVEAFDFAFRTYKSYLDDTLSDDEKAFVDMVDSLGISPNRAYMLLSVYKLSSATLKYVRQRVVTESENPKEKMVRVSPSFIFQLSTIQPKHQLLIAKGVIKQGLTTQCIRRAYNQWLEGLRNDDLVFKGSKKAQAEMENARAAIDRRERMIREIEKRGEPTTKALFSFAALSTDLKMLRADIDVALKTLKTNLPIPESEADVVKGLSFTIEDVEADLAKLKTAARAKTKALVTPEASSP